MTSKSGFGYSEKEEAVVKWVLENNRPAGRFTDTLSAADGYYLPLSSKDGAIGVIGINAKNISVMESEELSLFETLSHLISSALYREAFHKHSENIRVLEETQKLYRTLIDSVSHELKTPLAAIKGSASAMLDPAVKANAKATEDLLGEILAGSSRLQRLVENLLDMTRIESGMLKPRLNAWSIGDLIGSLLERIDELSGRKRMVEISLNSGGYDIICDPVLLEQAILNVVHNALFYSPEDKGIEIRTQVEESFLKMDIRDYGPGLPKDVPPERIFEKFYRSRPEKTGGLGIGLSIAKNLIELQHGKITAKNHFETGAVFSIYIPLKVN
ncbi:MAG: hypothetical protein HQK54_16635 [Oligoflexales bacterium]|nr:hypothetical protein [Oligoflexales bacterium]